MAEPFSQYRLAENEVIFREWNERQQRSIDSLNAMAEEDNQPEHQFTHHDNNVALQFYCECSDENCKARIPMRHSDYNDIHKNRKRFIVKTGHDVAAIERIVTEKTGYMVVEKRAAPPAIDETYTLNPTDLDHTDT
ncbi:MAG TPA: hypothetical protein VF597_00240 [Candidatus Saccharimonadales bacterium]|jgi:hypothetical protein